MRGQASENALHNEFNNKTLNHIEIESTLLMQSMSGRYIIGSRHTIAMYLVLISQCVLPSVSHLLTSLSRT